MKLIRRVALLLSLSLLINLVFVPTAWAQLPGPLEDMLREAQAELWGALQAAIRVVLAIPLWLLSRLCLYVGTLGTAFPDYFGSLITQTLDHVVSSNIRDIIQQSAYAALMLVGLSLLLKPLWPEFRPARFRRIFLWGALIGLFLSHASSLYSSAENLRMTTASNIAAVITGGLDSVDLALSRIGATRDEVQTADITALPGTVVPPSAPFTLDELFHRCPYDPANRLDTDPNCDLDHAPDPFEPHNTMVFNTAGLIILILGLFPSILVFAQGLAFLGMGLSAGMLFVVFPFTAMLAFYTPLEGIPGAVIKGYITLFIKTIILAVVSAMVLNVLQFDFMAGSPPLLAVAGIGLVEIFVMAILAKEGLSSVFTTFGLITNSVSSVGQNLGVAVGGVAQPFTTQPSTEAMMATAALTGGQPLAMAALGSASPYMMMGMMAGGRGRRQADGYSPSLAVRTALRAGREVAVKAGGAALTVINQAQKLRDGVGAGSHTVPLRPAEAFSKPHSPPDRDTQEGRERVPATRQKLHQMGPEAEEAGLPITSAGQVMAAKPRRQNRPVSTGHEVAQVGGAASTAAADATGAVAAAAGRAVQGMTVINQAQKHRDGTGAENRAVPPRPAEAFSKPRSPLDRYTHEGRERMLAARQKLHQMGPEAEEAALHIISASQVMAADWRRQNRHVQDQEGHLDPQFADSVVQNLDRDQLQRFTAAQRDLPQGQRVGLNEAIAIGAARPVEISQQEIRDSFAEAVRTIRKEESLDQAMRRVSDGRLSAGAAFGDQRRAAEQLVQDFRERGMIGERGAQLIRAVHDDLARNPNLTAEQFRQNHPVQMEDPIGGWDRVSGGAEHTDRAVAAVIRTARTGNVIVAGVPRVKARAATPKAKSPLPKAEATSALSTGSKEDKTGGEK